MGIKKITKRNEQSVEDLLAKIAEILYTIHEKGDYNSAGKVAELMKKVTDKTLTIAFCGHFSAGKSTFINEILQESLLPASPIPTSANVVKIQKGEELAHVYFFEGTPLEITPPISFEKVKEYCKNGDKVQSVAYQFPFENLPEDLMVLDTPGVDSTDDAHRVSTESALHLADVIFYVMDYNHVQSEVNLQFIRELQDKEKKIYLVVNQIDKHRESEIPFELYHQRIQESFDDWGIDPAGLYFTSLKEENHPLNDLKIVKETIQLLRQDKMEILPRTVEKAIQIILDEHKEWLFEQKDEQLSKLQTEAEENDLSALEVSQLLQKKQAELTRIEQHRTNIQESFLNQSKQILDNANITPYEMRELAEKYLESQQKGFKVGILLTSKKTKEEQKRRFLLFQEDVADRVKTQIEKFVHDHIFTFLKENGLYEPSTFEKVQRITVDIDETYISSHVKYGAGASGDAVLHYTKDLAQSIKRDYQQQVQLFMESVFNELDKEHASFREELKMNIMKLESRSQAYQAIQDIRTVIEWEFENLLTILYKSKSLHLSLDTELMNRYVEREYKRISGSELLKLVAKKGEDEAINSPEGDRGEWLPQDTTKDIAVKLEKATAYVEGLPGFQTVVHDLKIRAKKLENQTFTVALFGAFSAGKSSFANALFGERILPVSPNPTTASINKISPVTKEQPHGTVSVQVKSEEQLLQDVMQALSVFQESCADLNEAKHVIGKIIQGNVHKELESSKKPQFHFLKAFLSGWEDMHENLGSLLTVSLDVFESYVAQEEKSCFVEWIEVFYDCPFTREGLTLVDTPGADSINARHTDVAFEYIKNADAILFVTYYQHAFSKADREFLIQLGRVKDAFSLDKMFFLVNASDLANSREELQLVCDYVEEQLLAYGIRHPRLFPVSSLLALNEKEGKSISHPFLLNSNMETFEKAFTHFIQSDLVSMSVHAANMEIKRTVALLSNYLQEARLGKEEKETKLALQNQHKALILKRVSEYTPESFHTLLAQEVNELLFYVKQRTLLRFSDFFKEAFNPAVLKDDGRNIKEQLVFCIQELMGDLEHNLSQEVRATTVRIENYVKKLLHSWQLEIENHAQTLEKQVSFSLFEMEKFNLLNIRKEMPPISAKTTKQALGYFRNAKAFFEKNEKQKMSSFLEEKTSSLMDEFLVENEEVILKHYYGEMDKFFEQIRGNVMRQIEEYFVGMQAALSNEVDLDELVDMYNKLQLLHR